MNEPNPVKRGPGRPRVNHAPLPTAAAPADSPPVNAQSVPAAGVAAPEDPRIRAARRAAELREHGSLDDGQDKFYIDPRIIPDGWSYEYKRFTILGKEDPSYQVTVANAGWEPVPADRHPELMPVGYQGGTILRDGMMLVERPMEITEDRKKRDYLNAREQIQAKEEQLGAAPIGTFARNNKGENLAKISKTYEPIPIPQK